MKAKNLRCTMYITLPVFIGNLIMLSFQHNISAATSLLALTVSLQLLTVFFCRRTMKPLIHPDANLLGRIGINYVPIQYEPGRYKIDSKISSYTMWLTAVSPAFIWLAIRFPQKVTVDVLNNLTYTAPSMNLLIFGMLFLIVGVFSFPFWVESTRSAVIYAEGSDRKRYLLRGFVDRIEDKNMMKAYKIICRRKIQ